MPFGLRTWVGPDESPDPHGNGQFWGGEEASHCKVYWHSAVILQIRLNWFRCCLGCGLGWAQGIMLGGVQIPPWEGAILGQRGADCTFGNFVPWAVVKQLHRSICRLRCGLWWAKGSTISIVFASWHQLRAEYDWIVSAAAMRPYVKLLWPLLVIILSSI